MNWRRANKEEGIFTKQTLMVTIMCQHCSVLSMVPFNSVFEGDDDFLGHPSRINAYMSDTATVATCCLCVPYETAGEPWCACSPNSTYCTEFFLLWKQKSCIFPFEIN